MDESLLRGGDATAGVAIQRAVRRKLPTIEHKSPTWKRGGGKDLLERCMLLLPRSPDLTQPKESHRRERDRPCPGTAHTRGCPMNGIKASEALNSYKPLTSSGAGWLLEPVLGSIGVDGKPQWVGRSHLWQARVRLMPLPVAEGIDETVHEQEVDDEE